MKRRNMAKLTDGLMDVWMVAVRMHVLKERWMGEQGDELKDIKLDR